MPKYLEDLIKKFPQIKSGRKNYHRQNLRIHNSILLLKKYKKDSKDI